MPKRLTDKQRGKLGTRLREARLRAGLEQTEIAKAIGISLSGYAGWETGKIREPNMNNLREFVRVVNAGGKNNVTLAYLLDGSPDQAQLDRLERELNELKELAQRLLDRVDAG